MQLRALGTPQGGDGDLTSPRLLQHLLSAGSLGRVRMPGSDSTISWRVDDDDDNPSLEGGEPGNQDDVGYDDDIEFSYWGRTHARTPKWFPPVIEPQEEGVKLLRGGEFGRIGAGESHSRIGSGNIAKAVLSRRSKLRQTPKQDISNVRAVYAFDVSLTRGYSASSRIPVERLSHH